MKVSLTFFLSRFAVFKANTIKITGYVLKLEFQINLK